MRSGLSMGLISVKTFLGECLLWNTYISTAVQILQSCLKLVITTLYNENTRSSYFIIMF